jgi:hypothetical protein
MRTEKMVTRTVTYFKAIVMCVDVIKAEIVNKELTIPELIPEKKRLEYLDKKLLNDGLKAVQITSLEQIEELYGMSESEFLEHARRLEKR